MKLVFSILLSMIVFAGYSQENDWRLYKSDQEEKQLSNDSNAVRVPIDKNGEITIYTNNKLDTLLQVLQNKPPELKGFRVLIYIGNSRKTADEIRSVYLKKDFQWPYYLEYRDPNFVVEIGDFMTRLQAEKVKEQLSLSFSNPYIVLTAIKFPEYVSEITE
ncbi:MAG: hypothetical protein DRI54_04610 [Bacteroidetes bacterium]|nr:MAG: hypothetical protein DRI54_04610 [Bacteroidota bacterium]